MASWVQRLFGSWRSAAPAAAVTRSAPRRAGAAIGLALPAAQPTPALAVPSIGVPTEQLAASLLGAPHGLSEVDATADEAVALSHLRGLLHASTPPSELLPRASAVVPQLLSRLRQADLQLGSLSEQVGKDVVLAAEVLRVAASPMYRGFDAARDLDEAITRIGTVGLRSAIARVVLRPIFRGDVGTLSRAAEARLWTLSEHQSQAMAHLCAAKGFDRFEGYMAGMLHATGWTVALRSLDQIGWTAALPPTRAFGQQLLIAKDALFAKVVSSWALAPGVDALCHHIAQHGLQVSAMPQTALLRDAEQAAIEHLLNPGLQA